MPKTRIDTLWVAAAGALVLSFPSWVMMTNSVLAKIVGAIWAFLGWFLFVAIMESTARKQENKGDAKWNGGHSQQQCSA